MAAGAGFDLVILGAGSAAFAAAIRGAELGARVALTESDVVGGTCLNRGCVPTKHLLRAAEIYHLARHNGFPGLNLTPGPVDFARLVREKNALLDGLRREKYLSILEDSPDVELLRGASRFTAPHAVQVNGTTLRAGRFIIATGARPHVPPIPGLDAVDFLTNRGALELDALPESMVILGGGPVAIEFAQMFARFGTRVTVLQRGPRILKTEDEDMALALQFYLEEEGVEIRTGCTFLRVAADGRHKVVTVSQDGEERSFRGEALLVATGRRANTDGLGLERAGVEVGDGGFVRVDPGLRTSAGHIWAAGDVKGEPLLVTVAAYEGAIAAENALAGAGRTVDYAAVPRAVFTDPTLAGVGLTEEEARAAGHRVRVETITMDVVPKAAAIRDTRGLLKMVAEEDTGTVLGVHLVANQGAEIIHEAALAVRNRLTIDDIIDTIHVYPTMTEAIKIGALAFRKDVRRLSCCAT